jgi:nitroreductase
MDAYKTIISKRDTRQFSDKPISEESLRRILQAGRMAGSAKNLQPCRFVVIRSAEKKEAFSRCGQFAQHMPNAPMVIAVILPSEGRDFDAGRAAQNMMLTAWAEGITSCPTTMHDTECARQVLRLPEGHRVAIALLFAYPPTSGLETLRAPRLPIEELVHEEEW